MAKSFMIYGIDENDFNGGGSISTMGSSIRLSISEISVEYKAKLGKSIGSIPNPIPCL